MLPQNIILWTEGPWRTADAGRGFFSALPYLLKDRSPKKLNCHESSQITGKETEDWQYAGSPLPRAAPTQLTSSTLPAQLGNFDSPHSPTPHPLITWIANTSQLLKLQSSILFCSSGMHYIQSPDLWVSYLVVLPRAAYIPIQYGFSPSCILCQHNS